jgi:peptidoglycan/xylan/chitin deacetylase (PgdA/CDA1 family)
MTLKRRLTSTILGSSPAILLSSYCQDACLRILAYHRVLDYRSGNYLFDPDVISATPDEFVSQMQFVRDNFDVMSFRDLSACSNQGGHWPKRGLIVTFDDGYLDNYTNVYPIARQFGLPITVFLTAAYISSNRMFWWDLIAYFVNNSVCDSILVPGISDEPLPLSSDACRKTAIARILSWVKTVPEETKEVFLAQLPSITECPPPEQVERMHLNWNEVRKMSKEGIEFGSHSLTHPVLPNVCAGQLALEVAKSKSIIEQQIDRPIVVFSYPVGRHDARVRQAVADAGFHYAVAYHEGVVADDLPQPLAMPRIHIERDLSMSEFRSKLMFPSVMLRR